MSSCARHAPIPELYLAFVLAHAVSSLVSVLMRGSDVYLAHFFACVLLRRLGMSKQFEL
jgi:hypothetical protein